MKILFFQFLGKNHSWSQVGREMAQAFIDQGHHVDLFSTNGTTCLPDNLMSHLIGWREEGNSKVYGRLPDNDYDLQISYTAMPNWEHYFQYSKVKFAIWCYEWLGKEDNKGKRAAILPNGWAKYHKYVDQILAPSNFARDIFLDSGVPPEKVIVVPHGISKSFLADMLPSKQEWTLIPTGDQEITPEIIEISRLIVEEITKVEHTFGDTNG